VVPLMHCRLLQRALLAANVGNTCRIFSYENNGQAGPDTVVREFFRLLTNFFPHFPGEGLTVQNLSSHNRLLSIMDMGRNATMRAWLLEEELPA
jgi:hypothetical protein